MTNTSINESREYWRCRLRDSGETWTLSFIETSQIRSLFNRAMDLGWTDEQWVENFRKEFDPTKFHPSDEWVLNIRRGMELWDIIPLPCL